MTVDRGGRRRRAGTRAAPGSDSTAVRRSSTSPDTRAVVAASATASSRCYDADGRGATAPDTLDAAAAIGFRTVELDTRRRDGTPFTLVVNGRPVFVKGVNWIPDDCFPARVTARPLARAARPGARRRTST